MSPSKRLSDYVYGYKILFGYLSETFYSMMFGRFNIIFAATLQIIPRYATSGRIILSLKEKETTYKWLFTSELIIP